MCCSSPILSLQLCNQIMTGVNLLGVCEAFAFAQKAGLDLAKVHGALTGGAANSWALDVLGKRRAGLVCFLFLSSLKGILDDDYNPTFMVKLQQKDLRLVLQVRERKERYLLFSFLLLQAAAESGVVVPAAALSNQMLTSVEAEGRGDDGTQSLVRTYRKLSGLPEKTKN